MDPSSELSQPTGFNKKWIFLGASVLVLGLVLVLVAIFRKPPPPQLQKVKVKLRAVHNPQFAGLYYAQNKGYYASEGLEVEFEEATQQKPSVTKTVHDKEADFGVASAPDVIADRSNFEREVKAFATVFQHDQEGYIALQNSGIKELKDIAGKKVGLLPGTKTHIWLDILKMQNLSSLNYTTVKLDPEKLPSPETKVLTDKQTEVYSTTLTDEAVVLEKTTPIFKINPYDFGVTSYNDVLVTRDETIRSNPELVRKFLRASIRGWKDAIVDAEGAMTAMSTLFPKSTSEHNQDIFKAQIPFIQTNDAPLLWTDAQVWQAMYRRLNQNRELKKQYDVGEAYDTSFVRSYYGAN
jgi:NitT/TauT family transport system substrate-binding protein